MSLVEDAGIKALQGLNDYIALLRVLIGHASDARKALVVSLSMARELEAGAMYMEDGGVEDLQKLLDEEPFPFTHMQRDGWIRSVSGSPPDPRAYVDPAVTGRLDREWCLRVQRALLASGMTRHNPIRDKLLIAASANEGVVRLQETAYALIQLELSRSSQTHLPGYLLKQMKSSDSFVPEGNGVYRMVGFAPGSPTVVAGESAPVGYASDAAVLSEDADDRIT